MVLIKSLQIFLIQILKRAELLYLSDIIIRSCSILILMLILARYIADGLIFLRLMFGRSFKIMKMQLIRIAIILL